MARPDGSGGVYLPLLDEGVTSSEKIDLAKFEQRVAEAADRYEKLARRADIDPSA